MAGLELEEGLSAEGKDLGQVNKELLQQIEQAEAQGRLVIDLPAILLGDTDKDITLKDGDTLVVVSASQEVSIIGEVNFPTSHILDGKLGIKNYIQKSGGLTANADSDNIYVIKANGAVVAYNDARWFFQKKEHYLASGIPLWCLMNWIE